MTQSERPFLRRGPSGPLADGVDPAGACDPRFHELFCDANTVVPVEDQNGSICFPFESINAALASLAPVDPLDFNDFEAAVSINCAPGVYDEDVSLGGTGNLQGRSITIKGVSGGQPSTAIVNGLANLIAGPSVLIVDPTFSVTREITLDYSGVDGTDPISSIPPMFVFESVICEVAVVIGDGDPALVAQTSQTWKDCVLGDFNDQSDEDKYEGIVELRNSTFGMVSAAGAKFDCEHSVGISWDGFIGGLRSDKCIFDEILIDEEITGVSPILDNMDLTDTMVLTAIDEFVGGADSAIRMDSNTAFFCELFGSMSSSQERRVQDLTAQAYQHLVGNQVFDFDQPRSTLIVDASLVDPSPISLPFIAGNWGRAGANGLMGRQAIVKNRSTSSFDVVVSGVGGNTVEGGASVTLLPGEGAIFVPRTTTDWERIATIP